MALRVRSTYHCHHYTFLSRVTHLFPQCQHWMDGQTGPQHCITRALVTLEIDSIASNISTVISYMHDAKALGPWVFRKCLITREHNLKDHESTRAHRQVSSLYIMLQLNYLIITMNTSRLANQVSLSEYAANLRSSALSPCFEITVACHDINTPTKQLVPHPSKFQHETLNFSRQLGYKSAKRGTRLANMKLLMFLRVFGLVAIQVT